MKIALTVYCLLFLVALHAQQNGEQVLSLDGSWKFKTDPNAVGEACQWFSPSQQDNEWDSLAVPGNWDLRNEYSHYTGKAWYRKLISVPADLKNKAVRLRFDGVNFESKIWLNGKLIGENNIGYLPFEFDVSNDLKYGENNIISVQADNTYRLGAVWNWGGIRRPVRLIATDNIYLTGQYISPSIDLKNQIAEIAIRIAFKNTSSAGKTISGEAIISNPTGFKKLLPFSSTISANSANEIIVKTKLGKADVHLWNFDDPFLYTSTVSLKTNNHQISDRFGLRKIELDNKNYIFRLNGESIRVMGFNLVPDDRTTGSTLPEWRIKQDVDLMKAMGANMARLTHLPLTKEVFDYLDEKGIMVFPEIPLWGFHQLVDKNNPKAKQWLKRLIDGNYNHASIIGWSVGNEIGDSPGVMEYVDDAIRYAKSIDTTRLGVMISHTATRAKDPVQYSDLGLINKYGVAIGSLADKIHSLHPEKILFYSEYGYGQLNENMDADVDAKGMIDSLRGKPYLIGGSLWTFNDYRSSFVGTKEFSENRPWGVVDVFRQKKKAWYSFKREYAPVKALTIDESSNIIISPRGLLDLPAYPLHNYTLVWTGYNRDNQIEDGGFTNLPLISPTGPDIKQAVIWKNKSALSKIKIELVSPLNYCLADTAIDLSKPVPPTIIYGEGIRTQQNDMGENTGGIRVVFERKEPTLLYKIRYGVSDLSKETPPTLNNFIDIPKLPFYETYQVVAIAVNRFGESEPSPVKKIRIEPALAPPHIYYTEPSDKGFFVGYVTDRDDFLFRIQYTTKKGDYTNAKTLQTNTKGVLHVPGLTNGTTYFFRMSRIKDNNFTTGWSEEHMVVPDGGQKPDKPQLQGVLRNGTEAIMIFQPVKKAIAYSIQYRKKGEEAWSFLRANAAEIMHYKIIGLKSKELYEFRIAAENAYGESGFTETIQR